ncbi:unnamed protein product [Nippostrongylus brasiliensis]|uniref:Serpentine receptor class gamma n=1 Tax=Nippostrongylus brasiliensis TaxID=27835 RepID=A0A158QXL3_NIPBR|nr:unnamed protein product [Nippostrongylus brasiliensis]
MFLATISEPVRSSWFNAFNYLQLTVLCANLVFGGLAMRVMMAVHAERGFATLMFSDYEKRNNTRIVLFGCLLQYLCGVAAVVTLHLVFFMLARTPLIYSKHWFKFGSRFFAFMTPNKRREKSNNDNLHLHGIEGARIAFEHEREVDKHFVVLNKAWA